MEKRSKSQKTVENQAYSKTYSSPGPYSSCNGGSGSWNAGNTFSGVVQGSKISHSGFVGWDIPNFTRRKNAGELLPFTPWKQWSVEGQADVHSDYYHYFIHQDSSTYNHESEGSGVFCGPRPLTLEILEAKAAEYSADAFIAAAAGRIYSQSFDGSTFVAELGQVARMLKGFARRFAANVARGRLESPWLEARYGWRTLYYDMLDIEQAIGRLDDKRTRFVEKAGSTFTDTDTKIVDELSVFGGVERVSLTQVDSWSIGVRGTVAADAVIPLVRTNAVTTAWELLTLSFVIDWIIGVGTWLESMSLLSISQRVQAAGGFHLTCERSFSGSLYHDDNKIPDNCRQRILRGSVSGSYSGTLTLRQQASVPKLPQINIRLDEFKILDIIALILQRVRK